jgi:hypothetical protein
MRINRQLLLKIATDTVKRRVEADRQILAAFLFGSLNEERTPILGGTADVDIGIIHESEPTVRREIVRLTEDIHVDILHQSRSTYSQPRALRGDPLLGALLYGCKPLHDPRHFLDFAQASLRDNYFHPSNVFQRARYFIEPARQSWMTLQFSADEPGLPQISEYLGAVDQIAQALAALDGGPLPERLGLAEFLTRAQKLERSGWYNGLLGLLGAAELEPDVIRSWLPGWAEAFDAAGQSEVVPAQLHPYRKAYYAKAMDVLLDSERPVDAMAPLLSTWSTAAHVLGSEHPSTTAWLSVCDQLGLTGESFAARVEALDAFLDMSEEFIEGWGRERGLDDQL